MDRWILKGVRIQIIQQIWIRIEVISGYGSKESKFGLELDLLLNYLIIFNYKFNLISVRGRIDFKWGPGFDLFVRTGSELKLFPDTV